jgi:hypothetical protein
MVHSIYSNFWYMKDKITSWSKENAISKRHIWQVNVKVLKVLMVIERA